MLHSAVEIHNAENIISFHIAGSVLCEGLPALHILLSYHWYPLLEPYLKNPWNNCIHSFIPQA